MNIIDQKIAELGLTLPTPSVPVAAYVPYVISGNLIFISGQLPLLNGAVSLTGRLGENVDIEAGQKAAALCALNIIAQVKAALKGDLTRVEKCVKVGGFVSSTADFYEHPKVINGASELIQSVFGEKGQHARFAVGVGSLPRNAAVEVDAVFSFK